MRYDIVVIADLCVDILITADVKPIYGQVEQYVNNYQLEVGGSAIIFASQFSKLGGNIGLIGTVGDDVLGDFIKSRIKELKITNSYILKLKEFKTSVGLGLSYHGDRAMLTYKGSMNAITPKMVLNSRILDKSKHIHIASYYLLEQLHSFWKDRLANFKQQGYTVSLDTNWALNNEWQAVEDVLGYIDVFIPNEGEALRISKQKSIIEAGKWLRQFCGLVVIKLGAKGATVFVNNNVQHFEIPPQLSSSLEIADTTGAGDNFDAGFLYGWTRKMSIEQCVNLGLKCGTLSLSRMGGI
ncbi:MAG: carbohydrate kinase family protein, partial [Cyclobacteriaceae bacterium]